MPLLILLLIALVTGAYFSSENEFASRAQSYQAETETIAVNMAIYRNAVVEYAEAHPGFEGAVPDAQLNLPTWFRRFSAVQNLVSGGRAYVFASPRSGLVSLLDARYESLMVGTNIAGSLSSARASGSVMALPSSIPDKSVVIVR
jgi:hypothetical protein